MKWRADQRAANLRLLAELSVAPAASPTPLPSVIVWPETAVPYLLAAEPRLRQELAALVPQNGYLITGAPRVDPRSEEHTSELQSLMRISYAVFCLKKKKQDNQINTV